jgi:hypothetical protein
MSQLTALKPLSEPLDLLDSLRELAADRPATARAEAPRLLAAYSLESWGAETVPADVVLEAFESCRREIWLWVKGDRRWGQLSGWLAARVERRADR